MLLIRCLTYALDPASTLSTPDRHSHGAAQGETLANAGRIPGATAFVMYNLDLGATSGRAKGNRRKRENDLERSGDPQPCQEARGEDVK